MKQFNLFFYVILFIGFCLPSNSSFFIQLPGIKLYVRELAFILLPVLNLLGESAYTIRLRNNNVKALIIIFFLLIFLTEITKALFYNYGIVGFVKTLRIGLPLFSSLVLIYTGIRVNIVVVWKTLLWAIIVSVVLSLLSLYFYLPIFPTSDDVDFIPLDNGRLMNANAPFAIIGIFLLYRGKGKWYNRGILVKIASVLSIISLILTFNRTYLLLLVMAFIYLSISKISLRAIWASIFVFVILISAIIWYYKSFESVQYQVDKRILSIVQGETKIFESIFANNREVIYQGVQERIKEGYWKTGLPLDIPIFTWYRPSGVFPMSVTDTTFVNILLRYGILPMLLFISILFSMGLSNRNGLFLFALFVFFIASINIDSLMRHNPVFFMIIIFHITLVKNYEEYFNALAYKWSRVRR